MSDWHGLYSEGWTNEIVPDAFSHPAKFARGLIRRIYEHAVEEGWLTEGDTVIDPFAGVALGAVDALRLGLNWVGMELEPHFVDMGGSCECTGISKKDWIRCFKRWSRFRYKDGRYWCPRCVSEAERIAEQWEPTLPGLGIQTTSYKRNSGQIPHTEPHHYVGNLELFAKFSRNGATAVLLQGDSRQLCEVLDGARAKGIVASPPYAGSDVQQSHGQSWREELGTVTGSWRNLGVKYGDHPANLGNMREGDHVKACISSPPFVNAGTHQASNEADERELRLSKERRTGPGGRIGISQTTGYGQSAGQLAAMPEGDVRAVVSSPPYEGSIHDPGTLENKAERLRQAGHDPDRWLGQRRCQQIRNNGYGETDGQLGYEIGDTFWSAAKVIVSQCYQVLAPGGHAIWVVKDFVRNKEIVPFCEQWRELCESCGFETLHKHRCWLVEDRGGQYALNGDLVKKRVERKSFFRRLYEQKYPENSIDYEVVWCMRKPADAPLFADVAVREGI